MNSYGLMTIPKPYANHGAGIFIYQHLPEQNHPVFMANLRYPAKKKTIKLPWHISYVLVLDDIKSYWLVVSTPLKNMSSLVGMIFPN